MKLNRHAEAIEDIDLVLTSIGHSKRTKLLERKIECCLKLSTPSAAIGALEEIKADVKYNAKKLEALESKILRVSPKGKLKIQE